MSHIEQIPPYLTWKTRHKVMYPDLDFDKVILPNDDDGIHLGLFDNNTLISVVSLFRTDDSMQFRKFATLSEYQHKGYGSEILLYLLEYSKNAGCDQIWCNARTTAAGFYRKFGFIETDKTSQANGFEYVIMEKNL
ncbi:GNAT family N-acetyltransferase [Daejeonella sp.]|uniref:GNAT family N-acetyltransferase n=1 Tax=Daejeonella sp. TaxID=2805397 RepID=UPI0030C40C39